MSKPELNIHQLIKNPAIRHKLSYFVPLHVIDWIRKSRKPFYKTIQKIAEPYKEIYKDERSLEEIEKWLGEVAETAQ